MTKAIKPPPPTVTNPKPVTPAHGGNKVIIGDKSAKGTGKPEKGKV